jgi:hypothetical protein
MTQYQYSTTFQAYTTTSNEASAQRIVALVQDWLKPQSVVDFGCGQGVWLGAWQAAGVKEVQGVDGDYVDRTALRVPETRFLATDLQQPIDLKRRFDLVECLEVAEHIPESASLTLLNTLCRHGDVLLFSAAPPGQGGEHHVNEQPYAWWRDRMAAQGFELFDCIRPRVAGDVAVQPWYRYNVFLYVRRDHLAQLPDAIRQTHIPPHAPIPDVSPFRYRLRKKVVKRIPQRLADQLARAKAKLNR